MHNIACVLDFTGYQYIFRIMSNRKPIVILL